MKIDKIGFKDISLQTRTFMKAVDDLNPDTLIVPELRKLFIKGVPTEDSKPTEQPQKTEAPRKADDPKEAPPFPTEPDTSN